MHALHYLFSSTWFRDILSRVRRTVYSPMRSRRVKVDPENPATLTLSDKGGFTREKEQDLVESQSIREYNDHSSLIFVLNLCLLLATFTSFITLLAFRNGWQTGCSACFSHLRFFCNANKDMRSVCCSLGRDVFPGCQASWDVDPDSRDYCIAGHEEVDCMGVTCDACDRIR